MSRPKAEQTEVVKIRLGTKAKVKLQEIAKKECRTFADQCQLILGSWLAKQGRGHSRQNC
jgi:hypothetical protein